jgi:glycosyltransferase involved in cell wall biosynthesis
MKIVWLCYFSNAEIQSVLHPGVSANEFCPWISQLANLFEICPEAEVHIVSPQNNISGYKHFTLRNIHYHFFNPEPVLFGKSLARFHMNYHTGFFYMKFIIRKIVHKIQPDLIHLHGIEVDHSSSIFQFKDKFPILITIQGFVSNATNKDNYFIKKRIKIEQKILRDFRHFGYRTVTMGDEIKKINPRAELHWHHYPFPALKPCQAEKKYDIVFFARVTRDKGIEDLLQAIAIVKKQRAGISLCVIGGTNSGYVDSMKQLAARLHLTDSIHWAGYIPKHEEVHRLAASARISVLPTHHDIISGTIIESLFLKLPVVAYDVGSIHEINREEECVSLVARGDVGALAQRILKLLQDPQKANDLAEKAYRKARVMFDNQPILSDLLAAYRAVLADYLKDGGKIVRQSP